MAEGAGEECGVCGVWQAANLNWVQVASSDYSLHSNWPNVAGDDDDIEF